MSSLDSFRMPTALALWAAGTSLALLACSHEEPPTATALAVKPEPEPVVATELAPPSSMRLTVSESVRKKCELPENPSAAPQFDFDAAALRPRGETILDRIASCMRDGALRGGEIILVGRADPRGTARYNQQLGFARATAARDYLTGQGVAVSQLTVKSLGEQDASGSDPASWQLDRRVDIDESR